MAQEKQLQNNNISQFNGGLHTDNSLVDSPKGTYRFALNSVNETELGNFGFISNEESNEICTSLPLGHIPIGKCYLGNSETAIFSVSSDNTVSEIGILDDNCNYTTYINDASVEKTSKLNFQVEHQIQATYRLRRGCERTIYFTDDYNPPRYFNFDKTQIFKEDGEWVGKKLNLFREVSITPKVNSVEVLENSGSLKPGSYSILVQYLDEDFNPTQFLEVVSNINIYNDSLLDNYSDIQGSTNLGNTNPEMTLYAYEKTNKAIHIDFKNLDENFPYIRLAFVEFTNGTGEVSSVKYTEPISTINPNYVYTGENASTNGTIEEVELSGIGAGIKKAAHIEQIENRLLLANIEGEQAKLCKLQKYASKIKADAVVKKIILTSLDEQHNFKNPLVKYYGLGYQPGEVYSFGIIYLFADNTFSPVCHIPGKSSHVSKDLKYTTGDNVYPMSNVKNTNITETYIENSSCRTSSYWGVDAEGKPLKNTNVRHHRFPTRDELGLDFVKKVTSDSNVTNYKRLQLLLKGTIKKSVECAEGDTTCTSYVAPSYTIILRYSINGSPEELSATISPDTGSIVRTLQSNLYLQEDSITGIQVFYATTDSSGNIVETPIDIINGSSTEQPNGITYELITSSINENENKNIYTAPIFSIKFSDIELPKEEEIGKKVIGYQIVRQERKQVDKTILDSAVVLPVVEYRQFTSSSFIAPDYQNCESTGDFDLCNRVSKDTIQLLTPLHKFTDKTFDDYTTIEEVGRYKIKSKTYSGFSIQNVMDGTSAEGVENISNNTRDDDGFTLKQAIRFTEVEYAKSGTVKYTLDNSNKRMYNLGAVNYATHLKEDKTLYNLSCDNKSLLLAKNDGVDIRTYKPGQHEFPYVYIKKDNNAFYQNYRNQVYYTVDNNIYSANTCTVFGGDTHIAPLRYSTDIFANAIAGRRLGKYSLGKAILAGVIAIAGVALSVFTVGAAGVTSVAAIAALLTTAGGIILATGAILSVAATIVDVKKFAEIYQEKWEKGLANTMLDEYYQRIFIDPGFDKINKQLWYRDDTYKWFGEAIGDLWFETTLNISLRVSPREITTTNYLKPLKPVMTHRGDIVTELTRVERNSENRDGVSAYYHYADHKVDSGLGVEENYFLGKVTVPDATRSSARSYIGVAIPTIYMVNNDHNVIPNIKKYYQLPLQYDCCSECVENFPHRVHYSEQSFQEELSDNYRTFLSNNYRDIEGETGEITNIIRHYNNLFIHTQEALWQMPRNYQERVTDQIVSFIGTGSYFEIPPQKLIDDDTGSSAGCQHKWATIKTPAGFFFVSENQRKIYQFDGKQLKPISNIGISNWFENNIEVQSDKDFYNSQGYVYPNKNNPSNPIGTGFISTYDTKKERVIFTKKDVRLDTSIYGDDTQICTNGDSVTIFPNFSNTISSQAAAGWYFEGIENCRLKFSKQVIKTRIEPREVTTTIPNNADIIVHLDMSGSFNPTTRTQIKNAVGQWLSTYNASNPNWTGRVFFSEQGGYTSQRCWRVLRFIKDGQNLKDMSGNAISASTISKNIVAVSFVNENLIGRYGSNICYHPQLANPMGMYTSDFIDDYTDFKNLYNQHISTGGTFHALNYPINYSTDIAYMTQGFVQHVLAVLKGISYTQAEVDALIPNPFMSADAWNTLKASLVGNNLYPDDGLENYGWKGITNRGWNGSGDVITPDQFQVDMNQFLQGITTTTIVMTEVQYLDTEYSYIDGQIVENPVQLDNSWTISYSLKGENWVSWHSYMPNFYINVPEKFYSWKHGDNKIWRHNKLGHFQTYYGQYKPHIVEYTSLSSPITTRVWNHLMLQTEAKTYDYDLKQYHDERYVTFNKAVLYNSRQCSGEMDLVVKDKELGGIDYMMNQIINTNVNQSIIDRNERDWLINDFRDIRIDYTKPIWNSNISSLQSEYYIDKILNTSTLDINKDWTQLESFRDKYLVVRLIFDKFANKKLITNFSVENEQQSFY